MENIFLERENIKIAADDVRICQEFIIADNNVYFEDYNLTFANEIKFVTRSFDTIYIICAKDNKTILYEIEKKELLKFKGLKSFEKNKSSLIKILENKSEYNDDNFIVSNYKYLYDQKLLLIEQSPDLQKTLFVYANNLMVLYDEFFNALIEKQILKNCIKQIEWMHDSNSFFLIQENTFIYDLNLNNIKEIQNNSLISWRGELNVFAVIDKNLIKFMEPNGLFHGKEIHFDEEILNIKFNGENELFVITKNKTKQYFNILISCNNFWYKKIKMEFEGTFCCFFKNEIYFNVFLNLEKSKIDEDLYVNNTSLIDKKILNERSIVKYKIIKKVNCVNNIVFIIDDNKLYVTDFNKKIIPLPFYDICMSFKKSIMCFDCNENYLVFCFEDFIVVYDHSYKKICKKKWYEILNKNFGIHKIQIINDDIIIFFDNRTIYLNIDLQEKKYSNSNNNNIYKILKVKKDNLFEYKIIDFVNFNYSFRKYYDHLIKNCNIYENQEDLNSKIKKTLDFDINQEGKNRIDKIKKSLDFDLNNESKNNTIIENENFFEIYQEDKNYIIKCNEKFFVFGLDNLFVFKMFLITSFENKLVVFDLIVGDYEIYPLNEPNLRIITILKYNKILFMAPRGNFEVFAPKIMIKNEIFNFLESKKYRKVNQSIKKNFINFDLLLGMEIHLDEFYEKENFVQFVIHVYNALYIKTTKQNKIKDMEEELNEKMKGFKIENKYCNNKCENEKIVKLISKLNLLHSEINNSEKKLINKNITLIYKNEIKSIEDANDFLKFIMFFLKEKNYFEEMVKIYGKLGKIENALKIIKNFDLKFIKILQVSVEDEEIIKNVVGIYDLEFAKNIICILQKSIHLDFIISCSENELEKRISINKILDRKEKVLFYLSEKNYDIAEINYIKENNLYEILPLFEKYNQNQNLCGNKFNIFPFQIFNFLSEFDIVLFFNKKIDGFYMKIYAEYLYKIDKEKSIDFFISAFEALKAFDIACEIYNLNKALFIVENHLKDVNFYVKIIKRAIEKENFDLIGNIYKNYLDDKENAYKNYYNAKNYKECLSIDKKKFDDNLKNTINENLNDIKNYCNEIKENVIRFDDIIIKRKENYEDYLTETTFTSNKSRKSTKSKLRNKIGSRYEKEYVLDQLRQFMVKIKNSYNSILQIIDLIDTEIIEDFKKKSNLLVEEIKEKYNACFDYSDPIYDPERPIIAKEDMIEI
ncbi:hypothetical protein GVAV_002170 [Gurleya vavrai]